MPGYIMSLLFPYAAIVLLIGCWRWLLSNPQRLAAYCHFTLFSLIFCLLWNWPKLQVFTAAGFYPGDSLYTLGAVKAAALAVFTGVLLIILTFASWKITRVIRAHRNVPVSQAIVAALFNGAIVLCMYWLILSVIPQFYYMIYLQLFPDLPVQWVVREVIPLNQFASILRFSDKPSLASHAAGLLGWMLVINALLQWLSSPQIAMHGKEDL